MITVKNVNCTQNTKVIGPLYIERGKAYVYEECYEKFLHGGEVTIFIGVDIPEKSVKAFSLEGNYITCNSSSTFVEVQAELIVSAVK